MEAERIRNTMRLDSIEKAGEAMFLFIGGVAVITP